MNELQTVRQDGRLQHVARGDKTCGIEAKLCVLSGARRPLARAFTVKTYANADVRLHADFLCRPNRLLQLFEFFSNNHDLLAELAAKQRDANECSILVAIANDETLGVLMHRKRGNQLRFASSLEPEMKLRTC